MVRTCFTHVYRIPASVYAVLRDMSLLDDSVDDMSKEYERFRRWTCSSSDQAMVGDIRQCGSVLQFVAFLHSKLFSSVLFFKFLFCSRFSIIALSFRPFEQMLS